jgi:hypothetical protein
MALRFTLADLQRAQLLVENAMLCVEEQRNRLVWLTAIGHNSEQAEHLFETMVNILSEMVGRRDLIAEAIRLSRNGAA